MIDLLEKTNSSAIFSLYVSPLVERGAVLQREEVLKFKKRAGGKKRQRPRKKYRRHRKRAVLPPRPAIGSSPGTTKAFLE